MDDALPAAPAAEAPWLAGLNPPQREAVETLDGPLLVLSGAGTGKTRVLTARLALLLTERRAWPSQILAVTFTNRAAREMRERVEALIGEMSTGLWLGTFHALGLRILRRHPELVGLRPSFSILDMDDQVGTLEAGKLADVLVVNGNPAENVNDLWNVADVFFEGRKLERGSDDSLAAVRQQPAAL